VLNYRPTGDQDKQTPTRSFIEPSKVAWMGSFTPFTMTNDNFTPAIFVYHEDKLRPLPPMDLTTFKMLELPRGLEKRPLPFQLATAQRNIEEKFAHRPSPFGAIIGYEYEARGGISIFLNSKGQFASDPEPTKQADDQDEKTTAQPTR
jgi:hypothetical protein